VGAVPLFSFLFFFEVFPSSLSSSYGQHHRRLIIGEEEVRVYRRESRPAAPPPSFSFPSFSLLKPFLPFLNRIPSLGKMGISHLQGTAVIFIFSFFFSHDFFLSSSRLHYTTNKNPPPMGPPLSSPFSPFFLLPSFFPFFPSLVWLARKMREGVDARGVDWRFFPLPFAA